MKFETFYSCKKYQELHTDSSLSYTAALSECFWNKQMSEQALAKKYESVSFPFDWVKQQTVQKDAAALARFMKWLSNMQVVCWGMDYSYAESGCSYDGKCILCRNPNNGTMAAVIPMLQSSDRGFGGQSVHTNVTTLLQPLCAKFFLEERYPGIQIFVFYLFNCKDEGSRLTEVLSFRQKGANLYVPDYSGFYPDGMFAREEMRAMIQQVLRTPVKLPCCMCDKASLCKREISPATTSTPSKEPVYQMPQFTEEQQRVVNHLNGPMRVSAGPGSGKTATLVGRVKKLIDLGIYPKQILVVTFTQKAAKELLERCSAFCDVMPTVCTIHSICYYILRSHKDVIGKPISALTDAVKMEIVENLLSIYPQDGFASKRGCGKGGLFRTVARRIDEFQGCISKEAFLREHPELGNNFFALVQQYQAIVEARGLITFSEMIVMTNQLFAKHPDILKIYQSIYQYVMVDEFQDVDEEQARFIYAIASHGNLVVVGDDDQGIYGFRGGNGKFMLEFNRSFSNAAVITLSQNFRSTGSIVNASRKLIENNRSRIKKEIKAAREYGIDPIVIKENKDAPPISKVIKTCIKKGYSYGDIAVISTKNKPLEELHATLTLPNVLAKAYLRNTRLFLCILNILRLRDNPNNEYAQHELSLLGISHLKDSLLALCSSVIDLSVLITEVGILAGCEAEVQGMLNFVEQYHLYHKSELLGRMTYMERFEDETRADILSEDKVLLITAHESKGREFPVVIILDDYQEDSEESRRLYYVAMTRAKDMIYILRDDDCKTNFISEFEHSDLKIS